MHPWAPLLHFAAMATCWSFGMMRNVGQISVSTVSSFDLGASNSWGGKTCWVAKGTSLRIVVLGLKLRRYEMFIPRQRSVKLP